jgi:hypothetical protein
MTDLFDYAAGRALKDAAMIHFEATAPTWLDKARQVARDHARVYGTVCADDVQRLCPPPKHIHHNAMGSVFRGSGFVSVGFKQSARTAAHARTIRVYRLSGAMS